VRGGRARARRPLRLRRSRRDDGGQRGEAAAAVVVRVRLMMRRPREGAAGGGAALGDERRRCWRGRWRRCSCRHGARWPTGRRRRSCHRYGVLTRIGARGKRSRDGAWSVVVATGNSQQEQIRWWIGGVPAAMWPNLAWRPWRGICSSSCRRRNGMAVTRSKSNARGDGAGPPGTWTSLVSRRPLPLEKKLHGNHNHRVAVHTYSDQWIDL
jgi:hypothetical protein